MTKTISDDVLDMLAEAEKDFKTKLTVKVNAAEYRKLPSSDQMNWDDPLVSMSDTRDQYDYIKQVEKGKEIIFTYGMASGESSMKQLDKALQAMKKLTPSVQFDIK